MPCIVGILLVQFRQNELVTAECELPLFTRVLSTALHAHTSSLLVLHVCAFKDTPSWPIRASEYSSRLGGQTSDTHISSRGIINRCAIPLYMLRLSNTF